MRNVVRGTARWRRRRSRHASRFASGLVIGLCFIRLLQRAGTVLLSPDLNVNRMTCLLHAEILYSGGISNVTAPRMQPPNAEGITLRKCIHTASKDPVYVWHVYTAFSQDVIKSPSAGILISRVFHFISTETINAAFCDRHQAAEFETRLWFQLISVRCSRYHHQHHLHAWCNARRTVYSSILDLRDGSI
jgi:hypothetical protein